MIDVSPHVAQKLKDLSERTGTSLDDLLLEMLDVYGRTVAATEAIHEDLVMTEEEVVEMLRPQQPMTGKEIAQAGLLGAWEGLGIEDSEAWVAQQRARRRKKVNW